ncbi:MAG: GrdX family protein [Clostridia bacterium]|nr:GrdX family protein [Clostridia bacterium]
MKSSTQYLIVTNNPMVARCLPDTYYVKLWEQLNYEGILVKVRDYVYAGHKLYTHPLAGSVKPNETPYKSIVISQSKGKMSFDDAEMMSSAIETFRKFTPRCRDLTSEMLRDFQLIDYTLLCGALEFGPIAGLSNGIQENYIIRRCLL